MGRLPHGRNVLTGSTNSTPLLHDTFREERVYQLLSKIAEGGMSTVHLAEQRGAAGFKKIVALKMVLPRFSNNAEFMRLFSGEAKLVADLVHENIVQVYHLGNSRGRLFIAMEYVDGIDLDAFIATHMERGIWLDADLCAFIISRICRALEYAHNKRGHDGLPLGIVHRDVSPRNIMINYEGVVKLADFGIAKARRVMEQLEGSVLVGKAAYMSPEQARLQKTDRRSDLFSLGTVMYELLTHVSPFGGSEVFEALENVKRGKAPDPRTTRKNVPRRLLRILHRALEPNVSKRYASAAEMGEELERFLYHDRYGPTNVTLGRYVRELLLGIDVDPGEAQVQPPLTALTAKDMRSDTVSMAHEVDRRHLGSRWRAIRDWLLDGR